MPKIELGNTYKTKCGLSVEISKTDVNNEDGYCVAGSVTKEDGYQTAETWLEDGQFLLDKKGLYDLVEVKETKEVWVEIYKNTGIDWFCSTSHLNKPIALFEIDKNKSNPQYQFIALKRVVYSEGDIDE